MGERFAVDSTTGTAISLSLAGPGARSYAFIIDFHFRSLLAAACFGIVWLMLFYGGANPGAFVNALLWASFAIYVLYHPLLEILMRGRTPGKRIAGLRVVGRDGGEPGIGALLIRNVLRLVDGLPGLYMVGLASTMLTRDRVRIGDLAAGTLLVYDTDATELMPPVPGDRIDPAQAELVRELLARWQELEPASRTALAGRLLDGLGIDRPTRTSDLRSALAALVEPPR